MKKLIIEVVSKCGDCKHFKFNPRLGAVGIHTCSISKAPKSTPEFKQFGGCLITSDSSEPLWCPLPDLNDSTERLEPK